MKDVDVKVTKKVVDAEEVKDECEEPVFVEVKPSIREFWSNLSFKKKLGLILGWACAAAGGYFIGKTITSKAETAETLELPDVDIIENDEVE